MKKLIYFLTLLFVFTGIVNAAIVTINDKKAVDNPMREKIYDNIDANFTDLDTTKLDTDGIQDVHILNECGVAIATAITASTGKMSFRAPYAMTITNVEASVVTPALAGGSDIVIDINESSTTILSTKLSIDAGSTTSTTAATPVVISDAAIADDAIITIDYDQVGDTVAGSGIKVVIYETHAI